MFLDYTTANWQVGDVVFVWVNVHDDVSWNPYPQGWVDVWSVNKGSDNHHALFWTVVQEGQDETPTFDIAGPLTEVMSWWTSVWRGFEPDIDGYAHHEFGSGSNIATPDITTSNPGSYVFSVYWHEGNGGSGPATPPSGYTILLEDYTGINFVGVAYKRKEVPGLEDPSNWSVVGMGNAQELQDATFAFTSRTSELSALTTLYEE